MSAWLVTFRVSDLDDYMPSKERSVIVSANGLEYIEHAVREHVKDFDVTDYLQEIVKAEKIGDCVIDVEGRIVQNIRSEKVAV